MANTYSTTRRCQRRRPATVTCTEGPSSGAGYTGSTYPRGRIQANVVKFSFPASGGTFSSSYYGALAFQAITFRYQNGLGN